MVYTGDPAGDAFVRAMEEADRRSEQQAKDVMYSLFLPIALLVVAGVATIAYGPIKEFITRILAFL